jgi:hypothetical protein
MGPQIEPLDLSCSFQELVCGQFESETPLVYNEHPAAYHLGIPQILLHDHSHDGPAMLGEVADRREQAVADGGCQAEGELVLWADNVLATADGGGVSSTGRTAAG